MVLRLIFCRARFTAAGDLAMGLALGEVGASRFQPPRTRAACAAASRRRSLSLLSLSERATTMPPMQSPQSPSRICLFQHRSRKYWPFRPACQATLFPTLEHSELVSLAESCSMCLATLDQVLGKKASSVLPLEVAANRGWTDLSSARPPYFDRGSTLSDRRSRDQRSSSSPVGQHPLRGLWPRS